MRVRVSCVNLGEKTRKPTLVAVYARDAAAAGAGKNKIKNDTDAVGGVFELLQRSEVKSASNSPEFSTDFVIDTALPPSVANIGGDVEIIIKVFDASDIAADENENGDGGKGKGKGKGKGDGGDADAAVPSSAPLLGCAFVSLSDLATQRGEKCEVGGATAFVTHICVLCCVAL
jgi:hypothetical protein